MCYRASTFQYRATKMEPREKNNLQFEQMEKNKHLRFNTFNLFFFTTVNVYDALTKQYCKNESYNYLHVLCQGKFFFLLFCCIM